MNPGMNKMASVLQDRMRAVGDRPLVLDFGTIQADGSLITNTFPVPIPKSDYLVCRTVTLSGTFAQTSRDGNEPHSHSVPVPESLRALSAGDRVLVAWVQNDAVVIDLITRA